MPQVFEQSLFLFLILMDFLSSFLQLHTSSLPIEVPPPPSYLYRPVSSCLSPTLAALASPRSQHWRMTTTRRRRRRKFELSEVWRT